MPVALLIVLRVLFGSAGGLWTIVLLVAGIAGQAFISMTPALRTRSTRALFKKRSFQLAAGGTLLACLAPAVTLGLIDRSKHARIQSALASANPCDIATVVDVLATDGTDEEKSAAPAKQSACDEALSRKACDLLISHLDGNAVSPEDLAWLKAHGEPKDSDVVSSLSTHALTDSSDLLLSQSDLGCSGRIWDRLVKTLAVTPVVWVKATAASDDMKVSIVAAGLSPEAQAALGANAERLALSVDTRTPSDEMKGAAAMCELCGALKVATGRGCATVTARYAKVVAREQGAEAAASAAAAESAAADFRAGMQAQQGRIASCRAQISTVISLCKVNCHEKYGSFDPGPARDDLINKCESGCYDVAPSFDSCK
jgi:hypothetical protein